MKSILVRGIIESMIGERGAGMGKWDFLQEEMELEDAWQRAPLDQRTFSEWCEDLIKLKRVKRSNVIRKAELNPTFAYQIFAGERHAKRDKLIQLAFGLELNINLASEFIERGGANALDPRNRRDVAIAFCRSRNMTVAECDETLYNAGIPPLREEYPNVRGWW